MLLKAIVLVLSSVCILQLTLYGVASQKLLLRMQESSRYCYEQYGDAIDELKTFNPAFFQHAFKEPLCICELWWPSEYPTQLKLYTAKSLVWDRDWRADASTPANPFCISSLTEDHIYGCEYFTEDHKCSIHLWLGTRNDKVAAMPGYALMKCTIGNMSGPSQMPIHPVGVYEVSTLDIGTRCHEDGIKEMLNYRYAWHENKIFRDPSMLPTLHADHKCYKLAGEPNPQLMIQNWDKAWDWELNSDSPLCVCEDGGILQPNPTSKCPEPERRTCDPASTEPCDIRFPLFGNSKVAIWCPGGQSQQDPPVQSRNLGTKFFPNYIAMVDEVFIHHITSRTSDDSDFTGAKQFRIPCWSNETIDPYPTLGPGEYYPHTKEGIPLEWEPLTKWAEQAELAAVKIRDIWKNWFNQKTQYLRYNTDLHLHFVFKVSDFLDTFCPNLRDDDVRKDKIFLFHGKENFHLQLKG